jgi:septum formation topological specificity factor MinE
LDYDDPVAVDAEIPKTWWLKHDTCKYLLSALVHKDNKDISTKPTKLPPGSTQKVIREKLSQSVVKERSTAKAQRNILITQADGTEVIEKYGDIDHMAKKAKVDGMRSIIDKNTVATLVAQISVMKENEELYVRMMGQDNYDSKMIHLVNQMLGMKTHVNEGNNLLTPRSGSEDGNDE